MCHLVAHTTANTKLNYINAFSHRLRAFHLKASKYSIDSWGHFYFSKRTLTLRTMHFFYNCCCSYCWLCTILWIHFATSKTKHNLFCVFTYSRFSNLCILMMMLLKWLNGWPKLNFFFHQPVIRARIAIDCIQPCIPPQKYRCITVLN